MSIILISLGAYAKAYCYIILDIALAACSNCGQLPGNFIITDFCKYGFASNETVLIINSVSFALLDK